MKPERIYYYEDERKDEFSGVVREKITIDQNYQYLHNNPFWRFGSYMLYRIIMTPIAYLYMKCKFQITIRNKKALRGAIKKYGKGYFLYGNHTQIPGDGFLPTLLTYPVRDYVIVNADNLSLKGTRTFMEMVGACVIPNSMSGMNHFVKAVKYRIEHNKCVAIYPEAHIWPYFTGIRDFKEDSFAFPILCNVPAFCFTVTYQKKRFGRQPSMTVYIDGPFFAQQNRNRKEAQKMLRDQIYETMKLRSAVSDYSYVTYIKKES